MNYLFALLVLVALLVVSMAQYYGYYGHSAVYPYAYTGWNHPYYSAVWK